MRVLEDYETSILYALDSEQPLSEKAIQTLFARVLTFAASRYEANKSPVCIELFNPFVPGRARYQGALPMAEREGSTMSWDMAFPEELGEDHLLLLLELASMLPPFEEDEESWNGAPYRLVMRNEEFAEAFLDKEQVLALLPALAQGKILIRAAEDASGKKKPDPYGLGGNWEIDLRLIERFAADEEQLEIDINPMALHALLAPGAQDLGDDWVYFDRGTTKKLPGLLCLCTVLAAEMPLDEDVESAEVPREIARREILELMGCPEADCDLDKLMAALATSPVWKAASFEEIAEQGPDAPFARGEQVWRLQHFFS